MKRPVTVFGLALAMAVLGAVVLVAVTSAAAEQKGPPPKVFVCKYVGTPGVDERLQTGDNPISVSASSIKEWDGDNPGNLIGLEFADAQGNSIVIAIDEGQAEPDVSACPTPPGPTKGKLVVNKVVVNDDGGTKTASDFSFTVDGTPYAFEGDASNELILDPGHYTVAEVAAEGYDSKGGKTVEVKAGETTTVTITNNDEKAEKGKLIVNKVVVNDDGGTKTASDFSFTVDGTPYAFEPDGSNLLALAPGEYTIGEVAVAGYVSSIDDSTVTIESKKTTTVTITNNDMPPYVLVGDASVSCILPEGYYRVSGTVDGQAADEVEPATIPGDVAGTTEVTVTRGDTSVRKTVTTDGKCSMEKPPIVTPPGVEPPPVVTPPEVTTPAEPEGKPEKQPVEPKPAPLTPPTTKKTTEKAPAQTKPAPVKPPKQAVAGAYAESPPKLAHTP